ncbi:MAG TPA: BON domain-containing protein [Pyrinomonadaceae bacterium]|nr:BON domain-containing protein [Pyrinomonadaceae bacterium]
MSTRYDDRDDRDYDRDSTYYGQYNRRSSLDNTRSFGERAENRWGESRSGEGRSSEGRYGESGGGRGYANRGGYGGGNYGENYGGGSSYGGGSYSGGRENDRWSGGSRYGRESSSGGGRESGREGYWGRGWENERDDDMRESRYGSYGRSGAERGYSEGMRDYSSQRYNYPTGFRSGESYGNRGYDYGREGREGYDREGGRGWWDRASDAVASWFGDEEAERRRRMDQQREHRGRGPKGYRRSDERIKEDVNDRLSDDYYLDASDIEVQVSNTEVTLTGTVNNRNDKRRAEDLAESVSGVTNVENRLRVKQQSGYGDYSTSGTGTGTGTGTSMGTGTGTGTSTISGTPGTTTSSAAAGGGKSTGKT